MSEHLPGNLRERLRELREARKLDLYEVADIIHVSRSTYSRIESGTASLSSDALAELAKFYDVPSDYILGITNSPEKTYYELQELGLSVEAAKNLYSGKIDPRVINKLLTNDKFASAVRMMSIYFSGIMSDAVRINNDIKDFNYLLLQDLMASDKLPSTQELTALKNAIRMSKESPTHYDLDRIKNAVMTALKEIKDDIDSEVNDKREERNLIQKKVLDQIRLETLKIQHGRKLTEKEKIKKIVEIVTSGISLDPNMTDEMIAQYTPAITQIIETYAKYGKN
ncbi:MAG: helix-turn-helix transcriptional regulator [Lachnospiraceae bacterium]|nr:helix-turn-helix transcriptional regulator [Lachnospiraceae bacterium]